MKVAYLDIFFGISGDMVLGALVDAGVDPAKLTAELEKLNVHGWQVRFEKVRVHGLSATRATVSAPASSHDHHHSAEGETPSHHGRTPGELVAIVAASELSDHVKQTCSELIQQLAEAEATAHGVSVEEVHFHEVGGLDTIIDLAGAVIGFELLGVEEVHCSPIPIAHGFVECAHGRLPVPVPAVVNLLRGAQTVPIDVDGETVTPTGAVIATGLGSGFGHLPAMTLTSVGLGAGQKDFPEGANLLRIIVGRADENQAAGSYDHDIQILLEANIDDMNPELYEPAGQAIFAAGAVDCWFTPILMKKGRPAVKVSALAPPSCADAVAESILQHTTSFGVRRSETHRWFLDREAREVDTVYGSVSVKLGLRDGRIITASPEFADCRRLADEHQVTVKAVYQAAVAAAAELVRAAEA
jgi:pyridinium-3,5-bisthiocarboxylic acid mononucleotide nickel chelatase